WCTRPSPATSECARPGPPPALRAGTAAGSPRSRPRAIARRPRTPPRPPAGRRAATQPSPSITTGGSADARPTRGSSSIRPDRARDGPAPCRSGKASGSSPDPAPSSTTRTHRRRRRSTPPAAPSPIEWSRRPPRAERARALGRSATILFHRGEPSMTSIFRSLALRVRPAATAGLVLLSTAAAYAEEATPPTIDSGDTAWVLTASALVLMMTLPGLALFYGGLVRAKNVLNVLMQCMLSAGIVGVLWILVGYSLAFGTGNSFIGDFSKVGLAGVTLDSVTANFASPPRNIPEYVFIMFQAMFAIITPA